MIFVPPYSIVNLGSLDLHFHPAHLADLRASGLRDTTIRSAGVYSLRPADIRYFFSARKGVPADIETALCFPYQGGEFARIKLFPALGKMKYAQPPRTGAHLYLPFQIGSGAVYVCEGEKKTLAAWQAGLNAVGIGGVWNWLTEGEPIDDLTLIQWDGQDVTIIPDSDVFNRLDLMRASYALGCELRKVGVNVYLAKISQDGTAKVGLDDYLAAGGKVEALEVFSLGHKIFKSVEYWHGRWKFNKALKAA